MYDAVFLSSFGVNILTCELKSRIVMAKVAFNKRTVLFTSTLDLKLRKKLVKFYI